MAQLGISEAFARYGAKLKNVNWSVSAEASDGSLVVSLWQHHFTKGSTGVLVCRDSFARWTGPGNKEFRERVADGLATGKRVRLVLVETASVAAVESGADASKLKKNFFVREDLTGQVTAIEGDTYEFQFTRA